MTTPAVQRAQQGDEAAFRTLYQSVQPGLLRYLRVLVGSQAEDVASETWLQIVRDLGSFRGDDQAFRGWAARVARNRAIDQLRRQRRRPVVAGQELAQLPDPPSGDDTSTLALEAISTYAAVALVASLPRDQAEAVLLRVVLGLDAATAGRVLGKRAGAVRTAAHRGLRRLAALLEDPAAKTTGGSDGPTSPGKADGQLSPRGADGQALPGEAGDATLPARPGGRTLPARPDGPTSPGSAGGRTLPRGAGDQTLPGSTGGRTLPGAAAGGKLGEAR